jgi:hypothetical protein
MAYLLAGGCELALAEELFKKGFEELFKKGFSRGPNDSTGKRGKSSYCLSDEFSITKYPSSCFQGSFYEVFQVESHFREVSYDAAQDEHCSGSHTE